MQFCCSHQATVQSNTTVYAVLERIGGGTYSEVKLCKCLKSKKKFAMKIIDKVKMAEHNSEDNILSEIRIQIKLDHPNILKLVEYFEDDDNVYLIMELCSKGNLQQYKYNQKLNDKLIFKVVSQIVDGLQYIHSLGIVHRDIKPENILITGDDDVRICDFNWAAKQIQGQLKPSFCGTTEFMPPEVVLMQCHTTKVDIWSLGVLLYWLMTNKLPFRGDSRDDLINEIMNNNSILYNATFDIDIQDLIVYMLDRNADTRLSADDIPYTKWFVRQLDTTMNDSRISMKQSSKSEYYHL